MQELAQHLQGVCHLPDTDPGREPCAEVLPALESQGPAESESGEYSRHHNLSPEGLAGLLWHHVSRRLGLLRELN